MSVFVGLDCGGSSSRVLAIDGEGQVLFQGNSGAANLVTTPDGRLRRNLGHATRDCPHADFVCGCFAGLISEETRQRGLAYLREQFPGACLRAEPDYTAAFCACPEGTDICVIAGTGSLVCSRGRTGMVKSGGRGYLLGDFGSGYHFGREAVLYYLDHRAEATAILREAIKETFETEDEATVVATVYRSGTPATLLARLAKTLGIEARNGEPYAVEALNRHAGRLAETVRKHADKHMPDQTELTISLAGGLWKGSSVFRDAFAAALDKRLDRTFSINRVTRPPQYGAVELAREIANMDDRMVTTFGN